MKMNIKHIKWFYYQIKIKIFFRDFGHFLYFQSDYTLVPT